MTMLTMMTMVMAVVAVMAAVDREALKIRKGGEPIAMALLQVKEKEQVEGLADEEPEAEMPLLHVAKEEAEEQKQE